MQQKYTTKLNNLKTKDYETLQKPMTSFQFRTIKEKGNSLKFLSAEAHKEANYLAFSKRSSLLITLSSRFCYSFQSKSPTGHYTVRNLTFTSN